VRGAVGGGQPRDPCLARAHRTWQSDGRPPNEYGTGTSLVPVSWCRAQGCLLVLVACVHLRWLRPKARLGFV